MVQASGIRGDKTSLIPSRSALGLIVWIVAGLRVCRSWGWESGYMRYIMLKVAKISRRNIRVAELVSQAACVAEVTSSNPGTPNFYFPVGPPKL